jgi:regulator of RNase E activity RraA
VTDQPLELLTSAASATVCDALDRIGLREQALDPAIRPVWGGARIVGRAMPVVVASDDAVPDEPYEGEMDALDALSPGDVPVFEIDSRSRAAAWGELFSCAAIGMGAVGMVCDGLVRDAHQIEELGFAAFARGCSPLDTLGRAVVTSYGETAVCGGVRVARGDLIVADADGVVAVPAAVIDEVAAVVISKRELEDGARADLLNGMSIRAVWEKYQVF